jgi:predicted XRE-type DNA-binding protein
MKGAPKKSASSSRVRRAPKPSISIEEGSGNVFAELGLPDADIRLAKAQLARSIKRIIVHNDWTQAFAAEASGLAAPDMSDICRGNLARFSLERLERVLMALGVDIEVRIQPRRAGASRGALRVVDCRTP